MSLLNKQKFAKLSGIPIRTLHRYCADGLLNENGKGEIDSEDPKTIAMLKKLSQGKDPRKEDSKRSQKSKKKAPPESPETDYVKKVSNYVRLEERKIEAEINLKNEQALVAMQRRAQILGLLVPKTLLDQKLGKLTETISANIITVPRRGTAKTLAIIQSELEKQNISFDVRKLKVEIETAWKELVSHALEKAKLGEREK